ncbi:MAG: elongation factor P [Candidatus Midichloriaceae bacterium]|jgi:elongation factor P
MKIGANDIRVGNIIKYNDRCCVVMKRMHTQPGKGGAYVQIEMKDVSSGTKINHRFRSGEDVEKIRVEQEIYQYLYEEGDNLVLMNNDTYEQKTISKNLLGVQIAFLQEGIDVTLESYDDQPLLASLPENLKVVIQECESVVKGQTSTSSYKPALLENGIRITIPPFVNQGDTILIDTKEMKYIERVS